MNMEYRLVKEVITDWDGAETKSYYTECSTFGLQNWQKVKGTETGNFKVSENYYLDLVIHQR